MSKVAQQMALMVPSQSQAVYVQGGQQRQALPGEADTSFTGRDPGVSNSGHGNYMDLLRAGFWGGGGAR